MKIEEYIKKQGITVDIFSEMIGLSREAIYSYISGKRTPSLEAAAMIYYGSKCTVKYDDLLPSNVINAIKARYDRG